jgi:hypothetical protein
MYRIGNGGNKLFVFVFVFVCKIYPIYVLANAVVSAGCEVPCCIITLDATKE